MHSQNTLHADQSLPADAVLSEVLDGLSQQQKSLPSKYFYDTEGSELFDQICELDEYYPYRTEIAMLPSIAQDVSHMLNEPCNIVEFGAGSLAKIRILLKHVDSISRFTPIDIAGDFLRREADTLQKEFPHVEVYPVEADFTRPVELNTNASLKNIGFFPGSTIGNFTTEAAQAFLTQARETLGNGSLLLIGVDTKKPPAMLHKAYNDQRGITRKFNLNMLAHLNRETGADFDLDKFEHYAFYNPEKGRIEMHLISQTEQTVTVAGNAFEFREGESIHTENSHKYTQQEFKQLASNSGWRSTRHWMGGQQLFSVHLLQAMD
ncbi:L-histidine N(alpha)-methyltransferase [Maricurvus nonylphenolicus]|uniref:L-histidine N(alpha)-methyltransferase n=1 Tax=Maricurvus nonylphenolicus TaxID=1008307 RepID=UPI0036F27A79